MSVDGEAREAERLWRATPEDARTFERAVLTRRRAGLELPFDMLVRTPRWAPLARTVRHWFGHPLEPGDGLSLDEIRAHERDDFRHPYPEVLREWLQLAGRRSELVEEAFLKPALTNSRVHRDEGYATICTENQGVVTFAIAERNLSLDDPPVFAKVLDGREEWHPVHQTTSEFFLALALFFRVICTRNDDVRVSQAHMGDMLRVIREIERAYPRLPIAPWPWPTPRSRFVADANTLILISEHQIGVAARTHPAWARLDALVRENGGSWFDPS